MASDFLIKNQELGYTYKGPVFGFLSKEQRIADLQSDRELELARELRKVNSVKKIDVDQLTVLVKELMNA